MFPNPAAITEQNKKNNKNDLPQVAQLGVITLEELNKYHCQNPQRRLLSLFGQVFDVTSSEESYGPDGAYKELAGHDVTLAMGLMKTKEEWLDKFVKMDEKWIKDARGWLAYMEEKYPQCGRLDKWENEDMEAWPELTKEEREAIKGCVLM